MNSAGKHAVVALLVISIAGCAEKKANTAPPAQAQAPALDAGKAGALYPPPLTTSSTQPENPSPAPPPVVAQTQPAPPPQPPPSNTGKTNSKHKTKPSASKPATNGSYSGRSGYGHRRRRGQRSSGRRDRRNHYDCREWRTCGRFAHRRAFHRCRRPDPNPQGYCRSHHQYRKRREWHQARAQSAGRGNGESDPHLPQQSQDRSRQRRSGRGFHPGHQSQGAAR